MQAKPPHRRRHLGRLTAALVGLLAILCASPVAGQISLPVLSATEPAPLAALNGQVADPTGALIPGARIRLHATSPAIEIEATADTSGRFVFPALQPGDYSVSISAAGFETFQTSAFLLSASETRSLPTVTLAIPAHHADATVTVTRRELAGTELHTAEQQRIAGFPDFYTSFTWNAVRLDAPQKLSLGLHATTDRMAFLTAGLVSSAEQINGTFPGFGSGPASFGKRFGAAYADGFIGKFLGAAIFPSLLRQDPRYFYMGPARPLKERVRHAVLSGFLTRGDNGHQQPNLSHIFGNASAGALSSLYHPASDSAGKLALRNALLGTVGEAGVNLARELLLRRFMHGGDPDAHGIL